MNREDADTGRNSLRGGIDRRIERRRRWAAEPSAATTTTPAATTAPSASGRLRRAQRRDVGIGPVLHQQFHRVDVDGVRGAPKRRRPFDVLEPAVRVTAVVEGEVPGLLREANVWIRAGLQ